MKVVITGTAPRSPQARVATVKALTDQLFAVIGVDASEAIVALLTVAAHTYIASSYDPSKCHEALSSVLPLAVTAGTDFLEEAAATHTAPGAVQ